MVVGFLILFIVPNLITYAEGAFLSKEIRLTDNLKRYIVDDLFNHVRSQVANGQLFNQPPAADMQIMTWDDDLAWYAQSWANRCNFVHSNKGCHPAIPFWNKVGPVCETLSYSNTYKGLKSEEDIKEAVKLGFYLWINESSSYFYPSTTNEKTGHYTQSVWAKSNSVGCGIAQCNGMQGGINVPDSMMGFIFACEFYPGGNFLGEAPYKLGPACSACPPEASHCEPNGLCSPYMKIK